MLLANREVAKYVSKLAEGAPQKRFAFLYRIHDEPKADRIAELQTFVRAIGYEFGRPKHKINAKDIQSLLEQIKGKPEEHLIRTATLRSMAKAIYTTKNIGHFGLAFEYYTHFTSPIRRYPDMLVHRILASHLGGEPISAADYEGLERMCILASEQEAKAVDAEDRVNSSNTYGFIAEVMAVEVDPDTAAGMNKPKEKEIFRGGF